MGFLLDRIVSKQAHRRRAHHDDATALVGTDVGVLRVLQDSPDQRFVRPQCVLGLLALDPHALSLQRILNGGSHSFDMLLDNVVPRPGLHTLHRRIFVHRSCENDERHVRTTLHREFERGHAVEQGQLVVRDDERGAEFVQRREILLAGLHP